jgi:dTDP-4-amino-4,6-dideoxygalactose transaminase
MKSDSIIRLSKSCIGDAEKKAVIGVLDREYLGMGVEVQEFEKMLEAFFGRKVVCVANGTAALQLALQACGIGNGDEVLVPSLTYVASYQAISATGATPVSCDIDPETYFIDWRDAEKRCTNKTKAIMPVHYSGGIGNLDDLYKFAKRRNLKVIEDAAHAFGTTWQGKKIGGFGDIACFSFDGIKNITSGEGGCITSNDENIIRNIRDSRLLGVEKDTENRYAGKRSWEFDVNAQGWRYHMSNIMAAIGIEQLKRFGEFAIIRQERAKLYDSILSGVEKIKPLKRDYNTVVPHIYVVRIIGMKNRHEIQSKLLELGIQTGIHYQPNHMLSFYKKEGEIQLPVTEAIYPELLTLPLHPQISEIEVKYVVDNLMQIIDCK